MRARAARASPRSAWRSRRRSTTWRARCSRVRASSAASRSCRAACRHPGLRPQGRRRGGRKASALGRRRRSGLPRSGSTVRNGSTLAPGAFGGVASAAWRPPPLQVLGNGQDGKNDAGQFAMIDKIPKGESTVQFIFVAQQQARSRSPLPPPPPPTPCHRRRTGCSLP